MHTIYIKNIVANPNDLYDFLENNVDWDCRMASRKTASFGRSYNYSQISYPSVPMLDCLQDVIDSIAGHIGFIADNYLANFYMDGKSKMGYHSDDVGMMEVGKGIAIVSLGDERIIRFRNIDDPTITKDILLENGSLFYMTAGMQREWMNCIPKSDSENGRISLTFRKIKS